MVQYFNKPLCSNCKKPITGLAWQLSFIHLVPYNEQMVYNSYGDLTLRDRYIHNECYDEYFGDK